MGIFSFFSNRPDFAAGLEQARSTPKAVLLDVRTVQEYAGGHVPGSINLPLDRLGSIGIDKSDPVFIYCQSGARSGQASRYLKANGYTVTNIGGIAAYRGVLEKG